MKKIAFSLVLAFVFVFSLSVSTFAEGDIPTMGRNCLTNTACVTDGGVPIMGKTCPSKTTCVTEGNIPIGGRNSDNRQVPTQADDAAIFKTVLDYLTQIFS